MGVGPGALELLEVTTERIIKKWVPADEVDLPRVCAKCAVEKPATEFRSRRGYECKKCRSKYGNALAKQRDPEYWKRPAANPHEDIFKPFISRFPDEQSAHDFFVNMRWPNGVICPYCEREYHYPIKTRNAWRCRRCGKQFTAKTKTLFYDSPLSIRTWLGLVFLVARSEKPNSREAMRLLNLTQKTTYYAIQKINDNLWKWPINALVGYMRNKGGKGQIPEYLSMKPRFCVLCVRKKPAESFRSKTGMVCHECNRKRVSEFHKVWNKTIRGKDSRVRYAQKYRESDKGQEWLRNRYGTTDLRLIRLIGLQEWIQKLPDIGIEKPYWMIEGKSLDADLLNQEGRSLHDVVADESEDPLEGILRAEALQEIFAAATEEEIEQLQGVLSGEVELEEISATIQAIRARIS